MAPYMVEPQDMLASRELSGVIFVGPSQSGKTESLILNFIAYGVLQDPLDTILYSPTMHATGFQKLAWVCGRIARHPACGRWKTWKT